jgi:hypothetical protein
MWKGPINEQLLNTRASPRAAPYIPTSADHTKAGIGMVVLTCLPLGQGPLELSFSPYLGQYPLSNSLLLSQSCYQKHKAPPVEGRRGLSRE